MWKVRCEASGKFVQEKSFRNFYEATKYADERKSEGIYDKIEMWEV